MYDNHLACASVSDRLNAAASLLVQLRPDHPGELEELRRALREVPAEGTLGELVGGTLRLLEGLALREQPFAAAVDQMGVLIEQAIDAAARMEEGIPGFDAPDRPVDPGTDARFMDELAVEFAQEAAQHLDAAEAAIPRLTDPAAGREPLDTVFRAFHTITGAAGFLQRDRISVLARAAAELLRRARDARLACPPEGAELARRAVTTLRLLVDAERVGDAAGALPPGYEALLREMEASG